MFKRKKLDVTKEEVQATALECRSRRYTIRTTNKLKLKLSVRYRRDYLLEFGLELLKPYAVNRLSSKEQLPKRIVDSFIFLVLTEANQNLSNKGTRPTS